MVVTQRLLDIAANKNIHCVIGDRVSDGAKRPSNVNPMTLTHLSLGLLKKMVAGACGPGV